MRRTLFFFICLDTLLVGVFVVIFVKQQQEIRSLRQQIGQGPSVEASHPIPPLPSDAPSSPLSADERADYEKTIEGLKSQLDAAAEKLAATESAHPPLKSEPVVSEQETKGAPDSVQGAAFTQALQSPGMKEMIQAQQKSIVLSSNESLMDYLSLSPEEQQTLLDTLVEKQAALMEAGLSLKNQTPEAVAEQMKGLSQFDEKIKTLLGEEKYELYQTYQETQPERTQLSALDKILGPEVALTDQQEEELLLAMYEKREGSSFVTESYNQQTFFPADAPPTEWTQELVTGHLQKLSDLHDQYLVSAEGILTDAQLKQFAQTLKQEYARQEMMIRSAMMVFAAPSE